MKKNLIYCCFIAILIASLACTEQPKELSNTDAIGEADSLSPINAKESNNKITFKANNTIISASYIDEAEAGSCSFAKKEDGNHSMIFIGLGSNQKMKEKITLMLINYDLDKSTFPLTISPETKTQDRQARLDLYIQKSNVPINYYNQDNFYLVLESYKDRVLKGRLSGEVRNTGNRTIKIEDANFEVTLKPIKL